MQLFSKYVIDKIVYAKQPKAKHQKRLDSAEDYEILNCSYVDAPVMVPPANSSGETMAELETIAAAEALHKNPSKLEHKYDGEFDWAFKKVVEDAGLEYDEIYFKRLIKEAASITIRLKYKFNRPRPFQLGPVLGIDVTKYQSSTAKTPAFPSGHTTQSVLVACVLGEKYPELKEELMKVADKVSLSRVVGGHHYPSDIKYGELLGKWLSGQLKK
jgi:acid phosphatase (class A)